MKYETQYIHSLDVVYYTYLLYRMRITRKAMYEKVLKSLLYEWHAYEKSYALESAGTKTIRREI